MLKECLPVYPGGYSMILNKNSTSSTINSLQGLSGSSQSGWCCRNPSVFICFSYLVGPKVREFQRQKRPKRWPTQVGTLFNMVGAGQVGSTASSFDRFQNIQKHPGKGFSFGVLRCKLISFWGGMHWVAIIYMWYLQISSEKAQCQTPESVPGREVFGEVGAFGISKRRTASASTWEEGYVCCLRFTGAVRNLSDLNEAVVGCGV